MRSINQMLDSALVRAVQGPLHQFTFARGHGFAGRDVERLLTEKGIRVFERVRVGRNQLGFSVRAEHALWAEYILCRAGVPLTCELLDEQNERLLSGDNAGARSWLERVLDALAKVVS
jgi:hypothetical protein